MRKEFKNPLNRTACSHTDLYFILISGRSYSIPKKAATHKLQGKEGQKLGITKENKRNLFFSNLQVKFQSIITPLQNFYMPDIM